MIDFLGKKLTPYTDWDPSLNQCWRRFLLGKQRKYLGWDSWVKLPFSFTGVPQQRGSFCCQVGRKRAWTSLWVKSCIPGACTSGHFRERRKERSHNIASNKPRLGSVGTRDFADGVLRLSSQIPVRLQGKKEVFYFALVYKTPKGFPGGSVVKNPPALQEPPETWVRSLGGEDPLEEEMANRRSILAWEVPWTEEPGRLQSEGLQKSWTRLKWLSTHPCTHA